MAEQQREKLETPARFILFFAYLSLLRYARTQEASRGVPVSLVSFNSYFLVL